MVTQSWIKGCCKIAGKRSTSHATYESTHFPFDVSTYWSQTSTCSVYKYDSMMERMSCGRSVQHSGMKTPADVRVVLLPFFRVNMWRKWSKSKGNRHVANCVYAWSGLWCQRWNLIGAAISSPFFFLIYFILFCCCTQLGVKKKKIKKNFFLACLTLSFMFTQRCIIRELGWGHSGEKKSLH